MAIRVLRILEYVYENSDIASTDMSRWTRSFKNESMTMRSAELTMDNVPWIDSDSETRAVMRELLLMIEGKPYSVSEEESVAIMRTISKALKVSGLSDEFAGLVPNLPSSKGGRPSSPGGGTPSRPIDL